LTLEDVDLFYKLSQLYYFIINPPIFLVVLDGKEYKNVKMG
jgi:hypothetical protein